MPVARPSRRAQLDGVQNQSSKGGWLEEEVVHSRGAAGHLETARAGVQVQPGAVCDKDRPGLSCTGAAEGSLRLPGAAAVGERVQFRALSAGRRERVSAAHLLKGRG